MLGARAVQQTYNTTLNGQKVRVACRGLRSARSSHNLTLTRVGSRFFHGLRSSKVGKASRGRGSACTVASTERDPSLGGGGCAPPDSRDFAIFWPKCFREAATSVNSLQQGHVVVVNVSGIPELEDQQRAVDFIAGACYALEGQQDVLAESIFIFFPRLGPEYQDSDGTCLKHSQAARDALISLARSELKGSFGL